MRAGRHGIDLAASHYPEALPRRVRAPDGFGAPGPHRSAAFQRLSPTLHRSEGQLRESRDSAAPVESPGSRVVAHNPPTDLVIVSIWAGFVPLYWRL